LADKKLRYIQDVEVQNDSFFYASMDEGLPEATVFILEPYSSIIMIP
jgi:hypothetical protein